MTNLGNENLCADAEQAKRRAKSIKQRMKELGYEMSLTHAYEALASSCGYRNWPTMKAQLESGVAMPATSASLTLLLDEPTSSFLDDIEISFSGNRALIDTLVKGERGGTELLYAPPGKGKTTIACALTMLSVKQGLSANRSLPYMRIIDVGPSARGFYETVKEALPLGRKGDALYLQPDVNEALVINPFDLPLGFRQPSEHRKASLVNFLNCMLKDVRFPLDEIAAADLLHGLVSELYEAFSDDIPGKHPKLFDPVANPSLTRELRKLIVNTDEGAVTWWRIVDELVGKGQFDLAQVAQRYAVPTINEFLTLLYGMDDELLHAVRSLIFNRVQRCPMLGGPTTMDGGNARIVVVDLYKIIRPRHDVIDASLAFLLARLSISKDLYLTPGDWRDLNKELSDYHRRRYEDRQHDNVHIMYDEMHRYDGRAGAGNLISNELVAEMKVVKTLGFTLRLTSQSRSLFDQRILDGASKEFVLGVMGEELSNLRSQYQLSEADVRGCVRELNGPGKFGLPFAVFSKHVAVRERLIRLKLNSLASWAFQCSDIESNVRGKLVQLVGFKRAVSCLAEQFPDHYVANFIESKARKQASTSSEHSYFDLLDPVTEALIAELAAIA